jgi:ketosteroid isomerase-like protein
MVASQGEIAAAEQALYCAMIAQDLEALTELIADDAIYIHSTAVAETKAGYLAAVRDGLYEYSAIASSGVTTRRCGNVAVQTGEVTMTVGARGRPQSPIRLLFTLVWQRDQQGWRLWQRQATRVVV